MGRAQSQQVPKRRPQIIQAQASRQFHRRYHQKSSHNPHPLNNPTTQVQSAWKTTGDPVELQKESGSEGDLVSEVDWGKLYK